MLYVCSNCHTEIQVDADGDHDHLVCPNCGAEAGIEPVKDKTPPAMQYFGAILAVAAIVAIGGSLFGL